MMAPCAPVHALPGFKKDLKKRRKAKIPESEFKEGPQGLKYYDVVLGKGAEIREGARAVVHYEARWRGVTFMTSRSSHSFIPGDMVAALPALCDAPPQCHHVRAAPKTPGLVTHLITPTRHFNSMHGDMLRTSRPEE